MNFWKTAFCETCLNETETEPERGQRQKKFLACFLMKTKAALLEMSIIEDACLDAVLRYRTRHTTSCCGAQNENENCAALFLFVVARSHKYVNMLRQPPRNEGTEWDTCINATTAVTAEWIKCHLDLWNVKQKNIIKPFFVCRLIVPSQRMYHFVRKFICVFPLKWEKRKQN